MVNQNGDGGHVPRSFILLTFSFLAPVNQQHSEGRKVAESLGLNLDAWKHWHFVNSISMTSSLLAKIWSLQYYSVPVEIGVETGTTFVIA